MSKSILSVGFVVLLVCDPLRAQTVTSEVVVNSAAETEDWNRMEAAYSSQQPVLQNKLGQSVFVASFKGLEYDGRVITFSIWTDGAKTALPRTDFVWLQNSKMSRWFVVSWSDLEAAIGELPALEGANPPRYVTPQNIPATYLRHLEKNFVAPQGFPSKIATGRR